MNKIPYIEVAPSAAKKFLTGKGTADKNVMIRDVFRRFLGNDGKPIVVDDDNVADAICFVHIGRALLDTYETKFKYQQDVIRELRKTLAENATAEAISALNEPAAAA